MAVETHLMMRTFPPLVVQVTDEAPRPEAIHEALLVSFNSVPLYLQEDISPEDLMVNTRFAPLLTMKPPLLGVAPNAAFAECGKDTLITEPRNSAATLTNRGGLIEHAMFFIGLTFV